jgi:hypothetical protein
VKPEIKGLTYDATKNEFRIRELEVSITSKCHLRCDNCGFSIPEQPEPSLTGDIVTELAFGLSQLQRLNVKVGSLGILGGEPTFNQKTLAAALNEISKFDNIDQIELISHGLTPQNLNRNLFQQIDKLSISIYFESKELLTLWESYIQKFAPHIELSMRIDKDWDKWLGSEVANDSKAQEMFDSCWYRKHCVTLERQRLFMCSRIPKLSQDHEGIKLDEQTSLDEIREYLNQESFTASCKTCTPMMGLGKIKAGRQPDDRILKMVPTAIKYLKAELYGSS